MLIKITSFLAVVTNNLTELKKRDQSNQRECLEALISLCINVIDMAGLANYELNVRRHQHFKPEIPANYCPLFVPTSARLFGGEAIKLLEDIEKSTKAASKARPYQFFLSKSYPRSRPFNRRGYFSRGMVNRDSGAKQGAEEEGDKYDLPDGLTDSYRSNSSIRDTVRTSLTFRATPHQNALIVCQ